MIGRGKSPHVSYLFVAPSALALVGFDQTIYVDEIGSGCERVDREFQLVLSMFLPSLEWYLFILYASPSLDILL